MFQITKKFFKTGLTAASFWCMAPHAQAASVYFSIDGFHQNSTLGTQTIQSDTASGSAAFGLGTHFRLGLTHREKFDHTEDSKNPNEKGATYTTYSSRVLQKSNSLDLTIFLYNGEVVTPFLKAGMVVKSYDIKTMVDEELSVTKLTLPPEPSAGIGVAFMLTQNFSLRISYTVSPGVKELPDGTREGVLDSYTELGITYQI